MSKLTKKAIRYGKASLLKTVPFIAMSDGRLKLLE